MLAGVLPDSSIESESERSDDVTDTRGGGGGGASANKKSVNDGKRGKNDKKPAAATAAAAEGVAGTNLVAYNRIPRSMALEAIHAYLKSVAMEAPEKLTPDVLKLVVADMPRESLETRRYTTAETLEDIKARISRIGVATVGHQDPGLVKAYDDGDAGDRTDVLRHEASDYARAFNPGTDPWLTERQHAAGVRDRKSGVTLSNAEAYEMVQQVPLRKKEWRVGGLKAHDVAVAVAIGLSCALAVGAVIVPIVAPHVFDGTIQGMGGGFGGGGKSAAAVAARERRERQQRTMAADLRNSRAGHVVVVTDGGGTGVDGGGGGGFGVGGGGGGGGDRNWFDRGVDALGRSAQSKKTPVLPIPTVPGYSRDSLQQGFNFEIR